MSYFGYFNKEVSRDNNVSKVDFYEGIFADYYNSYISRNIDMSEIKFYYNNYLETGGNILELGAGNGRVSVPLSKLGANILAVEISESQIEILKKNINNLKLNIKPYNQDILNLNIPEDFSLAILPATTISLISFDKKRLINTFQYIYRKLPVGGRFIFDYRIFKIKDNYEEDLKEFEVNLSGNNYIVKMQEFNDFTKNISTLNILIEDKENGKKYIAYTDKNILSIQDIYYIISQTGFSIKSESDRNLSDDIIVRFVTLEKSC